MEKYVVSYDIGTTGVKTCLFRIDQIITLLESASMGYGLTVLENGGVEQNVDDWWEAMCVTTKKIFSQTDIKPEQVDGISFCSQMQGVVVVDKEGNALRPAMSYMDQRAKKELKEAIAYGPQIAGANLFKFLPYFYYTHAVSSSVKDPIFKYLWIKNNEPEVYDKIYKWLDVKEYLICRCTGKCVMTEDSAFATLLYDTRKGHEGWSDKICDMMGIYKEHLPDICKSTDEVGPLTAKAAEDLGLVPGIAVFGGGGDASLIPVGAGSVLPGDTHIYSGTSGWVGTVLEKQKVDVMAMIAAIVGAQEGRYNYFAEMETAAKCVEWVKDHLALDEVDIYLDKHDVTENRQGFEAAYTSLYDYLTEIMRTVPAGSNGVIFTPWLHGNRCPFEDPNAAGMFFNITLETGKREMIRAVVEGVCYHQRWMLEQEAKHVKTSDTIRFVGGGALSPVTCQILADVTGRKVETVHSPQNVGAVGAAAIMGVGLGVISSIDKVKDFITASKSYEPNPANKAVHDRNFEVFKSLYKNNKKAFAALNGQAE